MIKQGVVMKKKFIAELLIVFSLINIFSVNNFSAFAEEKTVLLGGIPAGFTMETRGAYIAGLSDVITKGDIVSPSKDAGLRQGDIIYFINGKEINNASDIESALKNSDNNVKIEFMRCGELCEISLTPALDLNGDKKIGVFIRNIVTGIGTVTFIDGNNIATLGHPVLDENEGLMKIRSGKIYSCNITGYVKGERGDPGELRGVIFQNNEIGIITQNTEYGLYGKTTMDFDKTKFTEIGIGEGKMGDAAIVTTINGNTPKTYSASIIKVDNVISDTKNYVIKITDKDLLETTGGIVQGMSGSPIIQDGKIIGAITHVFINDPTRGFGISINNMINNNI